MMPTGYGKMAIEEYAPGKVRLVQGGVVRTREAKQVRISRITNISAEEMPARLARLAGPTSPAPAPIDEYDSKLEAARATYWGYLLLAKDIKRVVHHPFTVRLSEQRTYTPDFLVEWLDGRLQVEEVKGSRKQKNARDSITRLHLAAAKLPMFDWRLTDRIRGQWHEHRIPVSITHPVQTCAHSPRRPA